ncbi:rap1 GTPase-activating protein 2-like [Plectropomus leopardus]|uniref:rap1 GTPase-activating protein 2-like n=1 Tax=Plectropomus leopardus TaxID=160734 RepID=UPI001C4AC5FF|nr:rap1 GTPase-activating protein 2-like [Plectropomus leopardus]
MKSAHFFDMMDKMEQVPEAAEMKTVPQRQKDDYIPYPRIEEVLERGPPYPQVILPEFGGYWIEDPEAPPPPAPPPTSLQIRGEEEDGAPGDYGYRLEEINEAARAYRKHFLGREHLNFSCSSSSVGNLLLSVRHEEEKEQESLHVIIRSRVKSVYHRLSLTELHDIPSVPELAKSTVAIFSSPVNGRRSTARRRQKLPETGRYNEPSRSEALADELMDCLLINGYGIDQARVVHGRHLLFASKRAEIDGEATAEITRNRAVQRTESVRSVSR